jgi:hypothetical protein
MELRLPLEEILDAPPSILQALVGRIWKQQIDQAERRRRQEHERDMAAANAMHRMLRGVG